MSTLLADSSIVPKDFQGKPGNVLVAVQWGAEIGLKPLQAMQNIAVINGRPSVWGDAVLALVQSSPACKDVIEFYEGQGDDYAAVCIAQRHGREDKKSRFSLQDAKAAGLLGKSGPWAQYRDRMLKMRARAFALRDQFADVLKGMPIAEEVMDYTDIPSDRPKTATQYGEAARATGETIDVKLIEEVEKLAREKGADGIAARWKEMTVAQRKSIPRDDWTRIRAIADEFDAKAKQGAAHAGPSYAQLMESIKAAADADALNQVLSDAAALPADQQAEIKKACDARAAAFNSIQE